MLDQRTKEQTSDLQLLLGELGEVAVLIEQVVNDAQEDQFVVLFLAFLWRAVSV